jgi:hypothetical protein
MTITKFDLGSDKAKEIHKDIINDINSYSLTITLNPNMNHMPVHDQYRFFSIWTRNMLHDLEQFYSLAMISYEFTKDYNIHAHCYFISTSPFVTLEQNFKKVRLTYTKWIGKNYKIKKIDAISPELLNYPFKDIERTTSYSKTENCLFNPYHFVIRSNNIGSLRSPSVGDKNSISKFLAFINSLQEK